MIRLEMIAAERYSHLIAGDVGTERDPELHPIIIEGNIKSPEEYNRELNAAFANADDAYSNSKKGL